VHIGQAVTEAKAANALSVLAALCGAGGPPNLDDVAGPMYWPELAPGEAGDA
jgi:hypothetical protein